MSNTMGHYHLILMSHKAVNISSQYNAECLCSDKSHLKFYYV